MDSDTITRPADCAARSAIVASTPTAAQAAEAAAAAARRLAATGVNPIPGPVTAATLLLAGGLVLVASRSRRRIVAVSHKRSRSSVRRH